MVWWKQYALSIICCVLLCGIITHIVSDLRYKKLIQLICGTLLAVTLLKPLSSTVSVDFPEWDLNRFAPDDYVNAGKLAALREQEECIQTLCESYISNKAKDLGAVATAEILLNEKLQPNSARVFVQSGSEHRRNLERILEEDLGITKENQVWILNQEESSS